MIRKGRDEHCEERPRPSIERKKEVVAWWPWPAYRGILGQIQVALVSTGLLLGAAHAGDPDILTDFVAPANTIADANLFTFRGFKQNMWGAPNNGALFKVTKASQIEFPGLLGQSVSLAMLQFAAGGVNPPHTHPRSSELLLVMSGSLNVGFVDSTNKLYTQTLQTGEMFVFPKGLVHFQMNPNPSYPSVAISAFGSANAGLVSIPKTVFGSGIDAGLLANSFKTDAQTIAKLVSAASA